MYLRHLFFSLILLFASSCGQSDKSLEQSKEPKVVKEVMKPKNGLEKLQAIHEGSVMTHGQLTTQDDKELSSASFKGQNLVLNYWATWCQPCMTDTPKFQEAAADYPNAKFVSISIDRDINTWKTFLSDENWSGNHYWLGMNDDNPLYSFTYSDLNAGDIKGVHVALPKYVIIGADGTIKNRSFPSPGTPEFRAELSKHLL